MKKKNGFIKGAFIIALGGFIAKILGAFYRIPLTNLIGGHGLGLYQLVYPVYCLLLTVSATGIPSSISKLTAEKIGLGESPKPLFKKALLLFLLIGGLGTVFMVLTAPLLAKAQGSEEVLFGYYALAPSVFLVSAISVFRGYFQGKNHMFPTALSEVVEQLVKVGVGLLFAYLYRSNVAKAVTFMLLAVSISELVALLVMIFVYQKRKNQPKEEKKSSNEGGRVKASAILRLTIPVTLSSLLLPLSGLLDSVLVPRLLSAYSPDAISLFGLFSGGAVTIVNLPVSVCYGIAVASVPAVATAVALKKETLPTGEEGTKPLPSVRKKVLFSLLITVLVSTPFVFLLYYFAEPAVKIVFRKLEGEELATLIRLVKIFSISALTLSCVQTLSACLTAQGKPLNSAIAMLVAVVVKTAVYVCMLQKEKYSVYGLAYATNICYLVAFSLDLLYNMRVSGRKEKNK